MLKDGKYKKLLRHRNTPGAAHYLTFSTHDRMPFLTEEQICYWLCDSIDRARNKHKFDLWAYVFMPDHVHLFIHPRNKAYDIGKILGSIKMPVSRKAVEYWTKYDPETLRKITVVEVIKTIRKFWEPGGGYDREVIEYHEYKNSVSYIHNNPVAKGLCDNPSDWKWSSASWYDGRNNQPLEIDMTMSVL